MVQLLDGLCGHFRVSGRGRSQGAAGSCPTIAASATPTLRRIPMYLSSAGLILAAVDAALPSKPSFWGYFVGLW